MEKDETPEERSETLDPSSRSKVTKFKDIYIYIHATYFSMLCTSFPSNEIMGHK